MNMAPIRTVERLSRIYDLLVSIGGAKASERDEFIEDHALAEDPCREWRFCGCLGFGGKYYILDNRVSCYAEDETNERSAVIAKLNAELEKLTEWDKAC